MRLKISFLISLVTLIFALAPHVALAKETYWSVQSIDTMKYSRDLAGQPDNPSLVKAIKAQVTSIAATGVTHVAIGTPYDDEFVPFLERWVRVARENGLKVWFRGNFSGWEGWFGYEKITRAEHLEKVERFILSHPSLFENGDIFTTCTECENGGPGDPRFTGDVVGYRDFLVKEYQVAQAAFQTISKNVAANYFSMNGDVAFLIMDRDTTEALGGIVVLDHYVKDPAKLSEEVEKIAARSGGKVVLGEFGAPIPDIHGAMTDYEQALWVNQLLPLLSQSESLVGINYWTSFGGTTSIWKDDGSKKSAVEVLSSYFQPDNLEGKVINELGLGVKGASVKAGVKTEKTDKKGYFEIITAPSTDELVIKAEGYSQAKIKIDEAANPVVLKKEKESIFFKMARIIYNFFR